MFGHQRTSVQIPATVFISCENLVRSLVSLSPDFLVCEVENVKLTLWGCLED